MANINSREKYAPNEYIWIVCRQSVYIKQLRISGPIVAPLKVKMATAYQIICSGVKLIQYNPFTQEYVAMTIANAFYKDKFPSYNQISATSAVATANTKADEEEPVVAAYNGDDVVPVTDISETNSDEKDKSEDKADNEDKSEEKSEDVEKDSEKNNSSTKKNKKK